MAKFAYVPNQPILLDEVRWVVERRNGDDTIQLTNSRSGASIPFPLAELETARNVGRLEFVTGRGRRTNPEGLGAGRWIATDLSQLDAPELAFVNMVRTYVRRCEAAPGIRWTKRALEPIIAAIHAELGIPPRPPGASTVTRWRELLRIGDSEVIHRATADRRRGNRKARLDPRLYEWAQETIAKYFRTAARLAARHVYEAHYKPRIWKHNRDHPDDGLPVPSLDFFKREIRKTPKIELDRDRFGDEYVRVVYRSAQQSAPVGRLGDLYEFDHHRTNLIAIDDTYLLPLGRAWLSSTLELKARYVPGIHVGFDPPSDHAMIACFRHAILPKADLRSRNPAIQSDWFGGIVPQQLSIDNELNHFGHALAGIGTQLDFIVDYAPPGHPWYKGALERLFGTLERHCIQRLPGRTFANLLERYEYNPAKDALIRFSTLVRLIELYFTDIYPFDPQSGLGDFPHRAWQRALETDRDFISYPPSLHFADVVLGKHTEVQLDHKGVRLNHERYWSPDFKPILKRCGNALRLPVIWYPHDMGYIRVQSPIDGQWKDAIAADVSAHGLTYHQHRAIQILKAESLNDPEYRLKAFDARGRFEQIVDEEMREVRGTRTREKLARASNIAMPVQALARPVTSAGLQLTAPRADTVRMLESAGIRQDPPAEQPRTRDPPAETKRPGLRLFASPEPQAKRLPTVRIGTEPKDGT